ncbi:unnamed protein product, partial [Ascophyllum nodosum]
DFKSIRWDFLLKSENGQISDFKNPGFRSHKTWSEFIFIVYYSNMCAYYFHNICVCVYTGTG